MTPGSRDSDSWFRGRRAAAPRRAGAGLRAVAAATVLGCLAALAGCSGGGPQFELNLEGREPRQVSPAQQQAIEHTLATLFGTPDSPQVPQDVTLDLGLLKVAAGPVEGDAPGHRHGLFRQYCAACHGISGSGAGPAAAMLNPYPRDFRRGVFKYTRTLSGAKPCRADLRLVIFRGAAGTAMPSHAILADEELEALVEYVRYLSLRGQTEQYLLQTVVDEDQRLPLDVDEVVREGVLPVANQWTEAETLVINPPPYQFDTPEKLAASVALGRTLYQRKESQCIRCHGSEGNGDGEEKDLLDDWNKPKKGITPEQTRQRAGLYTLPLQTLRPRNFHEGVFHGGPRPQDLFWRIYVGIKGTPMPPAGPAKGSAGVLSAEEIWHVANYIRSLSGQ